MKCPDDSALTGHDGRAIEEIRRQIDREFGPLWPGPNGSDAVDSSDHEAAASIGRTEPGRSGRGLRLALGAGGITLAAAIIGALMSFADLTGQSARHRVSAPPAQDVIATAPSDPARGVTGDMEVRRSAETGARANAEPERRGVPSTDRAATGASAAREARGGGHATRRVEAVPPGRGRFETQDRRVSASPVARTGSPVGFLPARSAEPTTIQAP